MNRPTNRKCRYIIGTLPIIQRTPITNPLVGKVIQGEYIGTILTPMGAWYIYQEPVNNIIPQLVIESAIEKVHRLPSLQTIGHEIYNELYKEYTINL